MTKGLHRLERGWIVAALVLFSLCAFPWLDLPGPEQDELYFIPVLEPYAYGPHCILGHGARPKSRS